ncbi:MAG: hypothetical protein H6515_14760 [Microthrixaceae bacterium]|nr:hypothetical protein [Microthrixaceae bacterium]
MMMFAAGMATIAAFWIIALAWEAVEDHLDQQRRRRATTPPPAAAQVDPAREAAWTAYFDDGRILTATEADIAAWEQQFGRRSA